MNRINREQSKTATNAETNGWWFVLACLPIAYIVQIMFLLSLSREGTAMADAAQWIDIGILLRSIFGLIWQPKSRDWFLYLGALFVCIPLIWSLYFLWALTLNVGH